MLSDEEKTTLEFIKINNEHKYCGKDDVDFLLNLIEKQSKEIEEVKQKEKQAYIDGTNIADQLCNKKWKDKIKAKIEELEKQDKESKLSHNYLVIPVLQSLLEKE